MKQLLILLLLTGLFYARSNAQVSVNSDGTAPDNSAMLDVKAANKGLLIPRIALTGTLDVTTIPSPATSLLIYNTATAGTPPDDVTPGYYYWNESAWVRLSVNAGGSGTTNYLPKWNSSGMLGNSLVFDNGTNVGIGTTAPSATLDVIGAVKITDGTEGASKVLTSDANGLASWQSPAAAPAAWLLTGNAGTAADINFVGTTDNSAFDIRTNNLLRTRITTKGAIEIFNTGQSVFLGSGAGYNDDLSDNYNVFIGDGAGFLNSSGYYNTATGSGSLNSTTTGYENTATGTWALLHNSTGCDNMANGFNALSSNTVGFGNTAGGSYSLKGNITGGFNTATGFNALKTNTDGSYNTAVGGHADVGSVNLENASAIGAYAFVEQSNSLVLGSIAGVNSAASSVNVGIGTTSPRSALNIASGGLSIGSGQGISTLHGAKRSLQVLTDTYYGGSYDNHSGFLIYSTMPGGWGSATLNFAVSTSWGDYNTSNPTLTMKGTAVGIGTTNPAASAALDVTSTTKGFLPPRVTYENRNGIANPAEGLIIWCSNCGASGELQVFNGTAWTNMIGGAASGFVCGKSIVDSRDGKNYSTVLLGTQCWMTQNLNVGTRIDGSGDQTNNSTIEKYCYGDLESNCDTYGGLYQWDEAMQYSTTPGVTGICPTGWHFPTDAEWTTLTGYINSQPSYRCNSTSGLIAKSMAATTLWNSSTVTCAVGNNLSLNNATGFSGLPGGYRGDSGPFFNVGGNGIWWSSTEVSSTYAWGRLLYYNFGSVNVFNNGKPYGFSVRCLRD